MGRQEIKTAQERVRMWAMMCAVVLGTGCAAAPPVTAQSANADAPASAEARYEAFNAEARAMARPLSASERAEVSAAGSNVAQAFETLHNATTFEDTRVGYSGDISTNARAFHAIHTSADAAAVFGVLARSGTAVGRLYGAIGLRHHDPKAFKVVVADLRKASHVNVETLMGCMGGGDTVGGLLEDTSADAVRLKPGQTLDAWFAHHKRGALDVVGGGYTATFTAVKLP